MIAVSTAEHEIDAKPVSDFVAITRADTGKVFQIATQKYQPVQNREVADFFREYCEAGKATMETIGGLRGATIWALAKLNGDKTIGGDDKLTGYMLLATAHDASLATVGRPTQVRVVCHNTLTCALGGKGGAQSFRMLHNTKWTKEHVAKRRSPSWAWRSNIDRQDEILWQSSFPEGDDGRERMASTSWASFWEARTRRSTPRPPNSPAPRRR